MTKLAPLLAAALISHAPAGYVVTPFGYFHKSCVHIAGQAHGACHYQHLAADGSPDIGHAWVEWAEALPRVARQWSALSANWVVPPAPSTSDGQTIYLFPGLAGSTTILQPVLGWNSDFPNAWGLASWNCCESGSVFEAPPIHVSSGDNIYGEVSATCTPARQSCPSWNVTAIDLSTGASSAMSGTSSFGQSFNQAYAGALEVYNVVQCNDYPAGGSVTMNNIQLFTAGGKQDLHPDWVVSMAGALAPSCSYNGFLLGQVILTY